MNVASSIDRDGAYLVLSPREMRKLADSDLVEKWLIDNNSEWKRPIVNRGILSRGSKVWIEMRCHYGILFPDMNTLTLFRLSF